MTPNTPQLEALQTISVTLLSCNRCAELAKTLESLCQPEFSWKEIIVADNASTDATRTMLRERFQHVQLIEIDKNQGVQGLNLAFEQASGDWILSLDDDSAPAMATWGPLLEKLPEYTHAAAVALSITAKPHNYVRIAKPGSPIVRAWGFSQAGCLFNRRALSALGGFDERLFLWAVELHWTAKAITAGWELYRCDSAQVVHRTTPLNRSSERHAFFYCRNLLLFVLAYAPLSRIRKILPRFLSDSLKYSVLHRSLVYWQALSQAQQLYAQFPTQPRLSESAFDAIQPDLRAPFAYLS